jgi:hypothetical protein
MLFVLLARAFRAGHHDCGMNNINPTGTLDKMVTQGGIPPESEWSSWWWGCCAMHARLCRPIAMARSELGVAS